MRNREAILADAALLYDFQREIAVTPTKADLILAAGSHDLRVPEHAAALYHRGVAPLVLCTGGFGKITDGLWQTPEGDVFAARCRELGVPEASLLVERASTNTGENFTLSRKLCRERGLPVRSGVAVCKPYMARRVWATGTKQWPEVRWQVSAPALPFEAYCADGDELEREIALLTGDLQRLTVYAEKGFQVPTEIPEEIQAAYERLVADGFDRYVIR